MALAMLALSACAPAGEAAVRPRRRLARTSRSSLVADVRLPGGATRFDYQEIDPAQAHLVVAHMNDASVLVLDLADGAVAKLLPGDPHAARRRRRRRRGTHLRDELALAAGHRRQRSL